MARIICISKYPPLEGGIAAKTFWLCRALAERGHTVHVVTDQENIDAEYSSPGSGFDLSVKNLHIHRPNEKIPWHIPNDAHPSLALLNTVLEVVDRYGADAIDTGYLIPYGLVGCLAGQITGIPFMLRHGGSDLHKFVEAGLWRHLLSKAFASASAIVTDMENSERFYEHSKRVVTVPPYIPNPACFKPPTNEAPKPTLALIGKANYHWRHKGWHRVVEIMKSLGDRFHYLVLSQGTGFTDFRKYVEERLDSPVEWRSFVHPLEMPSLLQAISGVFVLQNDMPFPVFSNLAAEALYCNVTVITDRHGIVQSMEKQGLHIDAESRHILVVPNDQPDRAAKTIADYFERPVSEKIDTSHREADYAAYMQKNEEAILSVLT